MQRTGNAEGDGKNDQANRIIQCNYRKQSLLAGMLQFVQTKFVADGKGNGLISGLSE